jgi:hypothetical protein
MCVIDVEDLNVEPCSPGSQQPTIGRSQASVRTTVNLPEREYEALKEVAERRAISFTHSLPQAIQTELLIQRLVDEGASFVVQREGGPLERLVFTQAAAAPERREANT